MRYETFEEISIGDIVSYNRVWGYVLSRFDDTKQIKIVDEYTDCLLYTSPSPRDNTGSRMPSSA